MTGFLGDIHWAIMVARVCQIYPRAPASVLVMKFFQEYSRWFWPNPVMLCLIDQKDPFAAWNGPGNKADESHVMPIITPAYPCRNSSAYVSAFTLVKLKEEFNLGFGICEVSSVLPLVNLCCSSV
jgi:poly(A) polymerase